MHEPLEFQIANRISRIGMNDSLDSFREWFVPISIRVEQSGNRRAIELAYEIDGILAEASSAGWSEAELREELENAIRPFAQCVAPPKWQYADTRSSGLFRKWMAAASRKKFVLRPASESPFISFVESEGLPQKVTPIPNSVQERSVEIRV